MGDESEGGRVKKRSVGRSVGRSSHSSDCLRLTQRPPFSPLFPLLSRAVSNSLSHASSPPPPHHIVPCVHAVAKIIPSLFPCTLPSHVRSPPPPPLLSFGMCVCASMHGPCGMPLHGHAYMDSMRTTHACTSSPPHRSHLPQYNLDSALTLANRPQVHRW